MRRKTEEGSDREEGLTTDLTERIGSRSKTSKSRRSGVAAGFAGERSGANGTEGRTGDEPGRLRIGRNP